MRTSVRSKLILSIFFGAFLAGAGCVSNPHVADRKAEGKPADIQRSALLPRVTEDQITAQNAHAQAQALRDEVERDR